MKTFKLLLTTAVIIAALGTSQMLFAQDAEATVKKDLQAVLALKNKACGQIVELHNNAENDYLVTCENGKTYRIWIDADDRVIVEERS